MTTNKVKENLTDWVITGWEKNKDVGLSCLDAHKPPPPHHSQMEPTPRWGLVKTIK